MTPSRHTILPTTVNAAEAVSEPITKELTPIELRKQEFIAKYGVQVLDNGQVSFTLPIGTSRMDLLNEAQALAPELIRRPAVYVGHLAKWVYDSAFTSKVAEATAMSIDGNVRNSNNMSRVEQEAQGLNNVCLCDLAAAHSVYLIATGENLFGGNMVRTHDGVLDFYDDGLGIGGYYGNGRYVDVVASAALPLRN